MRNKFLFYFLSWTWGLPMTLIGAIVALILIVAGHKPKRWGGCIYFNVGEFCWGGLELGMFFLTDRRDNVHTKNHEFGHAINNTWFGPLTPFLICIPSAIRYWYRKIYDNNNPYDSIWFEWLASTTGNEAIKHWNTTK